MRRNGGDSKIRVSLFTDVVHPKSLESQESQEFEESQEIPSTLQRSW